MCGDSSREIAGWPIDRIEQSAVPTAEQRAGFDEFADATIQAAQKINDACQIEIVFTLDDWKRCRSGSREWRRRSPSLARRSNASTVL
jgi:hypothetical protein